jgi:hypothetical protein
MDTVNAVFIVDPGMMQSFGHHHVYNRAFGRACSEARLPVNFFFNDRATGELLDAYPDSTACFTWSLYQEMNKGRLRESKEEYRYSAVRLCSELQAYINPKPDAATLVLAQTLDPVSLFGFALWYADLAENQRPYLALNLMLGVDDTPECLARLEAACSLLRDCPKVSLFGGTRAVGKILTAYMGRACPMMLTPLPEHPERYHNHTCPSQPVFGLTGDWRAGKNLQVVPLALMRYLAKGGQGTFTIQMTPTDERIHPVVLALHDLSRSFPDRVRLSIRYLDEHAYYRNMASFTAMIIPYTAEAYSCYRPSGLVIESAAMAVPAICTQGGFMHEELAPLQNGSLFMPEPTAERLTEALFRFEREMGERKALALNAAPDYCQYHDIRRFAGRYTGNY